MTVVPSSAYLFVNRHYTILQRSNSFTYGSDSEGIEVGQGHDLESAVSLASWIYQGNPTKYTYGIRISDNLSDKMKELHGTYIS